MNVACNDVSTNVDQPVISASNRVIRGIILYLIAQNLNSSEIYQKIVGTFGENVQDKKFFTKCFNYFLIDFATI